METLEFKKISESDEPGYHGEPDRWRKISYDAYFRGFIGRVNVFIGRGGAWHYYHRHPTDRFKSVVYYAPLETRWLSEEEIAKRVKWSVKKYYDHVVKNMNNENVIKWHKKSIPLEERVPMKELDVV